MSYMSGNEDHDMCHEHPPFQINLRKKCFPVVSTEDWLVTTHVYQAQCWLQSCVR